MDKDWQPSGTSGKLGRADQDGLKLKPFFTKRTIKMQTGSQYVAIGSTT